MLVPPTIAQDFLVHNATGTFAGTLSSFIERRVYLFGGYEEHFLQLFLDAMPADRRAVVFDIGANIGTHSLAFAQVFERVHSFEPNPEVWPNFERNCALSGASNIVLHKLGLGAQPGILPFYRTQRKNMGLGTVCPGEQYDLPLEQVAEVNIVRGDDIVHSRAITRVDAVKIDVQGFESEVLRGLADTLRRDLPLVWFELGAGTSLKRLKDLLPFPFDLLRFHIARRGWSSRAALISVTECPVTAGDYLAVPRHGGEESEKVHTAG
jgi:FkbM family methyltransferase